MEKREPVVLRYLNGEMEKCFIKPYVSCSLKVVQVIKEDGSVKTIPVKDLKAIFFVKDFEGKDHKENSWKIEDPEALKAGKKVIVTFKDGEKMMGKVLGDIKKGEGFFLYPTEINSNNIKVFVVKTSIIDIKEEE